MLYLMNLEILTTDAPPRDLLLLADECPASVDDYLPRGRCHVALLDGEIVGQYILLHTRPFTAEVVSLSVAPACQRRGIGTRLLDHAVRTARTLGFRRLEIGTGDTGFDQLRLYERCGFVRCGIDRGYFTRFYPTPVIENGLVCRDMVRLSMDLDRPAR